MSTRNIAAIAGLTPAQEGLLYHVIRDGARGAYHSQFSARLDGPLDAAAWHVAWQQVVARHDALRTLFTWEGRERPLQIVRERVTLPWQSLDWSNLDETAQHAALTEWLARDRDLGFTLDRAPLVRCALARLGPEQHRFLLSFHHLIMDGWSMRLALNEARALYATGRALSPAPSFTRFVEWMDSRDDRDDATFWKEQLGDFDAPVFPDVDLSTQRSTATTHVTTEGVLDRQNVDALTGLARELRVTLSSVVSAAYALVLRLYVDRDDLVFGTTVSGRPPDLPDVEHTVGLFINTLPLRVRANAEQSVADFVRHVHACQVSLRDREQSSAALAQRQSGVETGTPLFESILVYENFPAADDVPAGPDCEIDHFVEFSHFPLAVLAVPDEPFRLIAIADPERFCEPALRSLLDNLLHVLKALPNALETRLGAFEALSAAQRHALTDAINTTAQPLSPATTAWQQFCDAAAASPASCAVADTARDVSYAELHAQAIAQAQRLRQCGARPGATVFVMGPRSAESVAAMLGALGAGVAYCPVAADASAARLAAMVGELERDDGQVFAVAPADAATRWPAGVTVLDLAWLASSTSDAPLIPPGLDDVAYVMFTSGSTGTPKGVVVSHRNLAHSLHARDVFYDESPTSFLLLSTLPTDSSIAGLFWTLCRGGKLVLPADRGEQDVDALAAMMRKQRVTHTLTVPSLYGVILDALDNTTALRTVIVAGEACPASLVERHHAALPDTALINEYGPTETTVWCSAARLHPDTPVRIGEPLVNTRLYVVNESRQPVPLGAAGELCVGGDQVALRYAGDPERTAARFIPSPFVDGDRLYLTGDRVRRHADGELSFVGRVDDQIKVRGFRVEPGEIEAVLARHESVDEALVVQHAPSGAAARLVAWVVARNPAEPPQMNALRDAAMQALPAYMVPKHIELIDTLPRTAAGKADRRKLALRSPGKPVGTDSGGAPSNDAERTLAEIWRRVLGLDTVGIHDDFFALGGDSLLSIRVLARAGKAGLTLSPAEFFRHPTIAAQARAAASAPAHQVPQKPIVGPLPLMPIQHWFFKHITSATAHWNLSYRFDLAPGAALADLTRAVTAVMSHHDALRTIFVERDGAWTAQQQPPMDATIVSNIDLRSADDADRALDAAATALNASLTLDEAPLLRVAYLRTANGTPDGLLIVAHHLIVDAESWRILIEDLALALEQIGAGRSPTLPARTHSLRDFATRLQTWSGSDAFSASAARWRDLLTRPFVDLAPAPSAPRRTATEGDARTRDLALAAAPTAQLADAAASARASVYEVLVASVVRSLGQQLETPAVRIELEGHGRDPVFDDLDVSRTVGWFTSAYPVVVHDDTLWATAGGALRATKSALRASPDKGISYGALLCSSRNDDAATAVRAVPRASVLFNFLGEQQDDDDDRMRLRDERCGQARADRAPRAYLLEINAQIRQGVLVFTLVWPNEWLEEATIDALGQGLLDTLRDLLGGTQDTVVPEDFPLANLSADGLSDLSAMLDELDD